MEKWSEVFKHFRKEVNPATRFNGDKIGSESLGLLPLQLLFSNAASRKAKNVKMFLLMSTSNGDSVSRRLQER